MNVEETFAITIPDDVGKRITTVGELYDYIIEQTNIARPGTCLTASAFYDIREGLAACGITERFGPSTQLSEIFPKSNRRSIWDRLSREMQLKLPNLIRSPLVVTNNVILTVVASVILASFTIGDTIPEIIFPISLAFLFCFFGYLTAVLTKPFATEFARSFSTFRGLSERVLTLNAQKLQSQHGSMGRNDVWIILRDLIVDTLSVDDDEVTRDANFVADLDCE